MKSKGFDQAPVYSPRNELIHGIMPLSRAQHLLDLGTEITPNDNETTWWYVGVPETNLECLLEVLSSASAALVMENDEVYGMITISDLNSHSFRSILYHPIAEFEAKLAKIVEKYFPDPWDWLTLLSEQHQVTLVGSWELAKRKHVDTGPN